MKQEPPQSCEVPRLRVLHVISGLDQRGGGPAVALAGLARAQRRAGADVRVLSTYCEGDDMTVVDQLRSSGIFVCVIGPTRWPLARHAALPAAVREAVADAGVVHVHGLFEEVQHQAALAARRAGVPYIFRPCGMLDPWSLRQSRLKKALYLALRLRRDLNGAAALHYTAEPERDAAAAPLRLTPRAIVEPNGLDLSEFSILPPPGHFRARHPALGDRSLVLFLSRLHPKKGLELLLPAFAAGAPRDSMLVIAGPAEGTYRARLEATASALGINERVIFTGMLRGADRVAALADADLFVLPSYQENFGIAIIEALAAGTPAIISDQVNIHEELSAAGVAGVVPLDGDLLGRELNRWLSDAPLRGAAAARCRRFVWERYDWDVIARRWVQHYWALARGGSAGAAAPAR